MQDFFSAEKLEGDNQYECSNCAKHTNAVKTLSVKSAPSNLIINLKKFDKFGAKIKSGLEYPSQFKLNEFLENSAKKETKGQEMVYELYAVINHEGSSSHKGHYNCYVKNETGTWFVCDDEKVKKSNGKNFNPNKAYILFYRLAENCRQKPVSPRRISNVSTEDAVSDDSKSSVSGKPTSVRINRKRTRCGKKSPVSVKASSPKKPAKKRQQKESLKIVNCAMSESSDWTSSTWKRMKIEEFEGIQVLTEIPAEV